MDPKEVPTDANVDEEAVRERRDFLKKCGRFAAVTPPAISMMLSVAATPAHAQASGSRSFPGQGWGVGGNPNDHTTGTHPQGK
ncbi:hypothetical protein [Azospirillum sp.]|uniref:hypothetical protein n=1 Tax=Azospirillum sp. TaxID=34012 RepID=UPI003D72CF8B